ncbi:MAG: hypothetical protein AW11_03429 [Candidatus Accumulibacter regalis]|jgi:hypothetical protein|uniref:Uncharacterized protein n=1 Tax=Accumulibacter regalis TaxID=522306 RepID=A0A011PDD2_ACCRE|nr:MAG: hypothetical protein AW11_03429 [Candidatus Accumulibacter regalis]
MIDVNCLKNYAELVQSVLTSFAIVAGGVWTWHHYISKRQHVWNVDLVNTASICTISPDRVLVCLQVEIKNVGAVPFIPGDDGLQLSIRRVDIPEFGLIEWDRGTDIIGPIDILEKYKVADVPNYNNGYTLDVGAHYKERVEVALAPGCFYMLKTRLHAQNKGEFLTDYYLLDARPRLDTGDLVPKFDR